MASKRGGWKGGERARKGLTTARLSSSSQVRALTQPIRLEILQAFVDNEALGVDELAARLGRRPISLYYHVRHLVRLGILAAVSERRSVGRPRALYRPAVQQVAVSPTSPAGQQAAIDILKSFLRTAQREALRAATFRPPAGSSSAHLLHGHRMKGRLSPSDLKSVHNHLAALDTIFVRARASRTGKLMTLTTVLVPVSDDVKSG